VVENEKTRPALEFSSGGDAVPGGYNGYFVARDAAGRRLGYLDYQMITDPQWDDQMVEIAMVEVIETERRQGIGLALVERLQQEYPDRQIDWGYLTPEGMALRAAWRDLHPVAVGSATVWYHVSSVGGLTVLEPGLPSQDHIDRPRDQAVYLAKTPDYASERGRHVYMANGIDESLLVPDEDAVFDLLESKEGDLGGELRQIWQGWQGVDWAASGELLAASEDFSALSRIMLEFVDYLMGEHAAVATKILASSLTAAYLGRLPVLEIDTSVAPSSSVGERGPWAEVDGEPIEDLDGNRFPLNRDGTLSLYHRTSIEAARSIRENGRFASKEGQEVYFSTRTEGYATGYGEAVVEIRVAPALIDHIDDAFHGGEVHIVILREKIGPQEIVSDDLSEILIEAPAL
jgi:GNAT superfamily N-acetyltransferase